MTKVTAEIIRKLLNENMNSTWTAITQLDANMDRAYREKNYDQYETYSRVLNNMNTKYREYQRAYYELSVDCPV